MAAAEDVSEDVKVPEYDLIISFDVHSQINGKSLITDGTTFEIAKDKIIDVPPGCNITFLEAAKCGVSSFIYDNAAWTSLLKTSIEEELQKNSGKDLAKRIRPTLIRENQKYIDKVIGKRKKKQPYKALVGDIQNWERHMDTTWQIHKPKKYYDKIYILDTLDEIPEPFVVYYCRHPLLLKKRFKEQ